MKQIVRIIGGQFRGKKIHFPPEAGLRPTPDRVKETLFNWLMHDIPKARCLDAFAGSGGLGLEAFSRGAARVVFVEQSPAVYAYLNKTLAEFNTNKLQLVHQDALAYLKTTTEQFDIIFLDPPFSQDYLDVCLTHLTENHTLVDGGLLYVESPKALILDSTQWEVLKIKQAGAVHSALYRLLPQKST